MTTTDLHSLSSTNVYSKPAVTDLSAFNIRLQAPCASALPSILSWP
jgi:hypothetical protein